MKTFVASLLIFSDVYAFHRTMLFCPEMKIETSYKSELCFNIDELNTYMDMAPKMSHGFKNKTLVGSNTNSHLLQYTCMLGKRLLGRNISVGPFVSELF